MLCSSAVTMKPVSFAFFNIMSSSNGLTVCISITPTSKPSFFSSSEASMDSLTIVPLLMIVASAPSRIILALPKVYSELSAYTIGVDPLDSRKYAGPETDIRFLTASTVSTESAGITTFMFGKTRIIATSQKV